jgi:hypothetical protein
VTGDAERGGEAKGKRDDIKRGREDDKKRESRRVMKEWEGKGCKL